MQLYPALHYRAEVTYQDPQVEGRRWRVTPRVESKTDMHIFINQPAGARVRTSSVYNVVTICEIDWFKFDRRDCWLSYPVCGLTKCEKQHFMRHKLNANGCVSRRFLLPRSINELKSEKSQNRIW